MEINVEVPTEKVVEVEAPEKTAIEEAVEIVKVATDLAETIAEAGEESDQQVFQVMDKLDRIIFTLDSITVAIASLLAAPTVEEVVQEAVIEEAIEEAIEETPEVEVEVPVVEEDVPVAVTPQIKKKKSVKWL